MKKVYRQLLFFLSTLSFLIAAPLVILYAIGYRTNLTTADPLPVGVILVESEPRRATVSVDGRKIGTTPRAIAGLPAGEVTVRVELEGYTAWEKRLRVEPGRATEVRDIRLFPNEAAVAEVAEDVAMFSLSPSRRLLAVVDGERQVSVRDLDGELLGQPLRLSRPAASLLWSPTSSSVLVEDAAGTFHLVNAGETALPQALPALRGAQEVAWDPRISARVLYRDAAGVVGALNVESGGRVVLARGVKSFALSSRHVYAVREDGTVGVYSLQGSLINDSFEVPDAAAVRSLRVTPSGEVAYELTDGSLWVRDAAGDIRQVSSTVRVAGWSPDGQLLFVQPDEYALYVYNVADERAALPRNELVLVARLSRAVRDPQWFAGGRYLLYQVDDELLLTEVDVRDHAQTYQLDTTDTGTAHASVGEEGETVLYLKRDGETMALVQAKLVI